MKRSKVKLTQEELKCLDSLADAWNSFVALPDKLEHDNQEFASVIHAAQNHVALRVARRVDTNIWRQPVN